MTEIDRAKRYDIDKIELGLTYLAMHHGRAKKAERAMVKGRA
jgi:hypothetical protein